MRILFTFVGGRGHLEPFLPIANAARAAGHSVAFGCAPSMASSVESAGFGVFAMGPPSSGAAERLPLRAPDRAREERDLRERFVQRAARLRVPLTRALVEACGPDVLVCDETDFGAAVAAESLGLPFAVVIVIAAGCFVRPDVVGDALDGVRAEHGLPADPELAMRSRHLVLAPFPPSYRDPADPLPTTAVFFRPPLPPPSGSQAPPWSRARPGAPSVYFTLGTIFNVESGDLLARVVAGLRELPVNLVVTVGPDIDPAELGPQPDHVHVAKFIPQSSVLPHCDLVVSHAGSGSVLGALAHGLPSVLIPLGADQPMNAARCSDLGVALVLDAMELTSESVRAAVSRALDSRSHRRSAERLRDEIASLPEPAHAVTLLEALCASS